MTKDEKRIIKWIYNYWKGLKSYGMTEKQLIIEMNRYLESCIEGEIRPTAITKGIYEKE